MRRRDRLNWTAVGCTACEIRLGAPDGRMFARAEYDPCAPKVEGRTTVPGCTNA